MENAEADLGERAGRSLPLDFEMKFNDDVLLPVFMEIWVALEVKEGRHR